MIDQINELPEDGVKSSPETSRYIENIWFSQKIKISLTFLHLIATSFSKQYQWMLNDYSRINS